MKDELALVRAGRPDEPLPTVGELGSARAKMQRSIRGESLTMPTRQHQGHHQTHHRGHHRGLRPLHGLVSGRHRILKRFAIVLAGATAVSTVALVLPPNDRAGVRTPVANADPIQLLHAAAEVARNQPDVVPRPDQYYYVRIGQQQIWHSIDGMHSSAQKSPEQPSFVRCRSYLGADGAALPATTGICDFGAAYDPSLPTDASSMTTYLRKRVRNDLLQYVEPARAEELIEPWLGGFVQRLFETQYLRAPVRAALYEAITQLMSVELITADLPLGAMGVSFDRGATTLVFGAADHEYVGFLSTDLNVDGAGLDQYSSGLVDGIGQVP